MIEPILIDNKNLLNGKLFFIQSKSQSTNYFYLPQLNPSFSFFKKSGFFFVRF